MNAGQRLRQDRAKELYDHLVQLPRAANLQELMRSLRAVAPGQP